MKEDRGGLPQRQLLSTAEEMLDFKTDDEKRRKIIYGKLTFSLSSYMSYHKVPLSKMFKTPPRKRTVLMEWILKGRS